MVNDGGDKVTFLVQVPFELGFLSKADVSWSYYNDYTNLYSYCWWKCNYSLHIMSLTLIDVSEKYVNSFIDLFYLVIYFRESIRLFHGMSKRFVLSFSNDLGYINLINLEWLYDHDINPLDPFKVCVLLCSDKIHLQNVAITSLHSPKTTNKIQL